MVALGGLSVSYERNNLAPPPLSGERGTYKTVKARFWPWLSGQRRQNLSSCPFLAQQQYAPLLRLRWGLAEGETHTLNKSASATAYAPQLFRCNPAISEQDRLCPDLL